MVQDDIAYCAWRDACLVVVDVKDKSDPKLVVHKNWAPPFGGGTHNCLPPSDRNLLIVLDEAVLDEKQDGFKPIWVFDNQVKSNPISVATFPEPYDRDYIAVGGISACTTSTKTGRVVRQLELIFATYQNAGVRVYDIRDRFALWKSEHACPGAEKLIDPRPNRPVVLHSADVFVDANGLYIAPTGAAPASTSWNIRGEGDGSGAEAPLPQHRTLYLPQIFLYASL